MKGRVVVGSALVAVFVAAACDRPIPRSPEPFVPANRISLEHPRVGQESRYVMWTSRGYRAREPWPIRYQPDTLVLRVVSVDDSGAVVEERWANERSVRRLGYQGGFPARYRLRVSDDMLSCDETPGFVPWHSWLRWSPRVGEPIPLSTARRDSIAWTGWVPRFVGAVSPLIGMISDHVQLGTVHDSLLILVDDSGMEVDGPGIYLLYSKGAGLVRSAASNGFGPDRTTGFDLL